jgi:hypothetical protein
LYGEAENEESEEKKKSPSNDEELEFSGKVEEDP